MKNDCDGLESLKQKIPIALLLRGQSRSEAWAAELERCQKETNCISMQRSKIDWGLFGRTKEIMDGLFFCFFPFKTIARSTFVFNFSVCSWQGRKRCVSVCVCTNCVALATLRLCRLSLPVKTTDDEVSELRSRDATWGVCRFVCVAVGRLQIETWCVTWHDNPFPQIAPRPWQHAIYVWGDILTQCSTHLVLHCEYFFFSHVVHELKTN